MDDGIADAACPVCKQDVSVLLADIGHYVECGHCGGTLLVTKDEDGIGLESRG